MHPIRNIVNSISQKSVEMVKVHGAVSLVMA